MQDQYINSFKYSEDKIIIDKYPLNLIELDLLRQYFQNQR